MKLSLLLHVALRRVSQTLHTSSSVAQQYSACRELNKPFRMHSAHEPYRLTLSSRSSKTATTTMAMDRKQRFHIINYSFVGPKLAGLDFPRMPIEGSKQASKEGRNRISRISFAVRCWYRVVQVPMSRLHG